MSAVLVEDGPDKGAIWHFGEPVKEQRALEAGTAWADLSHLEIVAIKGEDRLTWLHALTTQHHEQLQPGQWQEALILDPQGHVEYQFLLVDDGDTVFLVLDPGYKESLIEYLNKMKFMLRVDVRDASSVLVGTSAVNSPWLSNKRMCALTTGAPLGTPSASPSLSMTPWITLCFVR